MHLPLPHLACVVAINIPYCVSYCSASPGAELCCELYCTILYCSVLYCAASFGDVQDELADLSEQQVKHLYGHSGSVTGLSYSTDQALLFSSSADGTVRLWSTQWCKNLAAYR